MSEFSTNIVTHLPSTTLGTLFKNPNKEDPNIYVLFCGHCCRTDEINATFLTYDNLTLNAKILNVNIWIDAAVAVLENPSQIGFPITTEFDPDPFYEQNEEVNFFSNYQINNSLARPIPSNVRDPNYRYPQNTNHFFYPESILLREAQGVKGVSGSPVIDSKNKVVGLASKIVGDTNSGMNAANNLVVTKMSMIYLYLFSENYGLIPAFYTAYQKNPSINFDFNLLVAFRNSFNIVICHTGFRFLSNRENIKNNNQNFSKNILGSLLSFRMTGLNKNTYGLVDFLQKNDPEIYYFRTLFDGTDLLNDFYKNKTQVLFRTLEYTDRASEKKVIDFGIDSFAPYYVNGDPSQPITVTYRLYEPSGEDGINMVYGPLKTITVQPIIVDDSKAGKKRWSSQLPMEFTSTTSRANAIMQRSLFNQFINGGEYFINYASSNTYNIQCNAYNSMNGETTNYVGFFTGALTANYGFNGTLNNYTLTNINTNSSNVGDNASILYTSQQNYLQSSPANTLWTPATDGTNAYALNFSFNQDTYTVSVSGTFNAYINVGNHFTNILYTFTIVNPNQYVINPPIQIIQRVQEGKSFQLIPRAFPN